MSGLPRSRLLVMNVPISTVARVLERPVQDMVGVPDDHCPRLLFSRVRRLRLWPIRALTLEMAREKIRLEVMAAPSTTTRAAVFDRS